MHNPGIRKEEPSTDTSLGMKTKFRLDLVLIMLSTVASFTLIYAKLIAMENMQRKSWTIQHQIMWENQLTINNPTIKVPTADGVVTLMNQQSRP